MEFPRLLFKGRDECTVVDPAAHAAKLAEGWTDSLLPKLAPEPTTTQTAWPKGRKKAEE